MVMDAYQRFMRVATVAKTKVWGIGVCGVLWAGAWETIKKAGGYDKVRPLIYG